MALQEVHTGPSSGSASAPAAGPIARWLRARALANDLAVLIVAQLLVGVLATLWLVARTAAGRLDIGDGDAAVAMALVGGVIPAWLAWLALDSLDGGGTRGQRRAGLTVQAQRARERLLRLALEPRGFIAWCWLALLFWVGEAVLVRMVSLLALLLAGTVVAMSAGLWLIRPAARSLHDRIAGTRLVRR